MIKRLLERIDNAVKKPNRNIFAFQTLPSDVSKDQNSQQANSKNHLKYSRDAMIVPGTTIRSISNKQSQGSKLNYQSSVVYENELKEIENFTLGPIQYSNIKSSFNDTQIYHSNTVHKAKVVPRAQNMKKNTSIDRISIFTNSVNSS